MAGQKFVPHGVTLSFSSADVGGLANVSFPERTRGEAEVTDNDSGGNREFLPALRDGGQVTIECYKIPGDAGQAAMLANYESDLGVLGAEEAVITLPSQANDDSLVTTLTFDAFVADAGSGDMDQTADEAQIVTFVLRVTGAVTEATA